MAADSPRLGLDHPTVVPTNFAAGARSSDDGTPDASAEDADRTA
jgi:hypothetical protein